jgi:hypothetical protein
MRRGSPDDHTSRRGPCGGPRLAHPTEARMTRDDFENVSEQQAEAWIAQRFRAFALNGLPPDLSLMFAVHPEIDAPVATGSDSSLDAAA